MAKRLRLARNRPNNIEGPMFIKCDTSAGDMKTQSMLNASFTVEIGGGDSRWRCADNVFGVFQS